MITEEQRLQRKNHIGSSDVGAILGIDPYRSASDVYLEKTQNILKQDEDSDAIDIGNSLERPLVEWAGKMTGIEVEFDIRIAHEDGIMACNLDGRGMGEHCKIGFEAKTTSNNKEWGDPGTDQVPERVIAQAHQQMYTANLEIVYVPVFMPKFDRLRRDLYRIERNDDLVKAIVTECHRFWIDNVVKRIPPSDFMPSISLLSRLQRTPGSLMEVPSEVVARYEKAQEIFDKADKLVKSTKAQLLLLGGDAEIFDFTDDEYVYTYMDQTRKSINTDLLKIKYPDIYKSLTRQKTYKVLRKTSRAKFINDKQLRMIE